MTGPSLRGGDRDRPAYQPLSFPPLPADGRAVAPGRPRCADCLFPPSSPGLQPEDTGRCILAGCRLLE